MGVIMEEEEEVIYEPVGSPEWVKGMWSTAIQQYLSYISEESGISMRELLGKFKSVLGDDEGVIGLLFSVTDDDAYEMFIFKAGKNEGDPIDATFEDVMIVNDIVKLTIKELDETD